jgi:hypothetical protein
MSPQRTKDMFLACGYAARSAGLEPATS